MIEPSKSPKDSKIKRISETISIGKDLFSLLRDLSLFILAFLLLLLPTQFNIILVKAGFEEGSFLGLKWKKQLNLTNTDLQEANVLINDLKKKNNQLDQALAEAQKKINDPSFNKEVTELRKANEKLNATTQQVQESVNKTLTENTAFIDKAAQVINANQWGVVYGGDTSLEDAQYEINTIAKKYQIPNTQIFYRENSYRSVSLANTREEAKQVLSNAKNRRQDSYIVNMSQWCPNPVSKDGYIQCQ